MKTIKKIKVQNLVSPRSGVEVRNQFKIRTPEGIYFQSYNTIIAFRANDGTVYLDARSWDYSVTTSKYRNQFLGENKAETQAKIQSGAYKLIDLN